jgi:hypothetical protein
MPALFGTQFAFSAIVAFVVPILLPLQTIDIVGKADKARLPLVQLTAKACAEWITVLLQQQYVRVQGTALGFGLSVATVVATVVSLASGQASDHIYTCLVPPLAPLRPIPTSSWVPAGQKDALRHSGLRRHGPLAGRHVLVLITS